MNREAQLRVCELAETADGRLDGEGSRGLQLPSTTGGLKKDKDGGAVKVSGCKSMMKRGKGTNGLLAALALPDADSSALDGVLTAPGAGLSERRAEDSGRVSLLFETREGDSSQRDARRCRAARPPSS